MRLAPKLVICGLLPGLVLAGVQLASGSSAAAEQPALWDPSRGILIEGATVVTMDEATQSSRTAGSSCATAGSWRSGVGRNRPRVSTVGDASVDRGRPAGSRLPGPDQPAQPSAQEPPARVAAALVARDPGAGQRRAPTRTRTATSGARPRRSARASRLVTNPTRRPGRGPGARPARRDRQVRGGRGVARRRDRHPGGVARIRRATAFSSETSTTMPSTRAIAPPRVGPIDSFGGAELRTSSLA